MQQTYSLGAQGTPVGEIQSLLVAVGVLTDAPVPSEWTAAQFDEATMRAVRHFQQQRGLSVDGRVGPETWRHLEEARWRLGDRVLSFTVSHPVVGDDVQELQQRLLGLGFDTGPADGWFGARTEIALRAFQRESGLLPDGVCGPATFAAFRRLSRAVTGGEPEALRAGEALRVSGPSLAGKVIVIDPGHGGQDRGHRASDTDEAQIVEDVASRLEGRINAAGAIAYLSRGRLNPGAEPPDVMARAAFANRVGADLFVSLHVDAEPTGAAHGVATFFYGDRRTGAESTSGRALADLVQREITARTDLTNCRSHGKSWDLLRRTTMPAVRIDLGYLSHDGDAARLADPAFRDLVAEAVLAAVQRLYLPPGADQPTGAIDLAAIRAMLAGT